MANKPKGSGMFIWKETVLGLIENTEDGYIIFRLGISRKRTSYKKRVSTLFQEMLQEIKKFAQENNLQAGFYEINKKELIYQTIWIELEDLEKNYPKLQEVLGDRIKISNVVRALL